MSRRQLYNQQSKPFLSEAKSAEISIRMMKTVAHSGRKISLGLGVPFFFVLNQLALGFNYMQLKASHGCSNGCVGKRIRKNKCQSAFPLCQVTSVMADTLQSYGLQPTRLLYPWDFLRKNRGGSVLLCPPPGDLPDPGKEPTALMSPSLAGRFFFFLPLVPPEKPFTLQLEKN